MIDRTDRSYRGELIARTFSGQGHRGYLPRQSRQSRQSRQTRSKRQNPSIPIPAKPSQHPASQHPVEQIGDAGGARGGPFGDLRVVPGPGASGSAFPIGAGIGQGRNFPTAIATVGVGYAVAFLLQDCAFRRSRNPEPTLQCASASARVCAWLGYRRTDVCDNGRLTGIDGVGEVLLLEPGSSNVDRRGRVTIRSLSE